MEKRTPLFILTVAQQLALEASQSLLSRTTLHFDGDATSSFSNSSLKVANISVTLDANLGIIFEHSVQADRIYRQVDAEAGEAGLEIYLDWGNSLSYYTGAWTARGTAHLHFRPIGSYHAALSRPKDSPPLICSQTIRHTIKQLVGFRKVVMVLEFVVKAGDANLEACRGGGGHRNNKKWDLVLEIIDVENTDTFDDQGKDDFKRLTADVGKDFERNLGSYATHFVDQPNGDFTGIITYHPRKALDTINQKAAKDEENSSQMMKAMTESSIG